MKQIIKDWMGMSYMSMFGVIVRKLRAGIELNGSQKELLTKFQAAVTSLTKVTILAYRTEIYGSRKDLKTRLVQLEQLGMPGPASWTTDLANILSDYGVAGCEFFPDEKIRELLSFLRK